MKNLYIKILVIAFLVVLTSGLVGCTANPALKRLSSITTITSDLYNVTREDPHARHYIQLPVSSQERPELRGKFCGVDQNGDTFFTSAPLYTEGGKQYGEKVRVEKERSGPLGVVIGIITGGKTYRQGEKVTTYKSGELPMVKPIKCFYDTQDPNSYPSAYGYGQEKNPEDDHYQRPPRRDDDFRQQQGGGDIIIIR